MRPKSYRNGCVHGMKKWLTGLAAIMMTFSLAACSKTVATTSGGKITESEYYDSMKKTSQGKQQLQQMILNKVLEGDYGKKVSDKKVDKQYNAAKKQYGKSFDSVLQQSGFDKAWGIRGRWNFVGFRSFLLSAGHSGKGLFLSV